MESSILPMVKNISFGNLSKEFISLSPIIPKEEDYVDYEYEYNNFIDYKDLENFVINELLSNPSYKLSINNIFSLRMNLGEISNGKFYKQKPVICINLYKESISHRSISKNICELNPLFWDIEKIKNIFKNYLEV